jgi:short-subunit dehydrogenase
LGAVGEPRPGAVVTGASGGIGLEIARLLAADGHDLALVARSGERLAEVARELTETHGVRAHPIVADLGRRDAPGLVEAEVASTGLTVDVLVNNAGFAVYGPFLGADGAGERAMIDLNVAALTDLTRRFAVPMVERGRGRILQVASTAAFQPLPSMVAYSATKAYVLHFSVGLAVELEGTGVTVTALCPGATRTGFADRAGASGSRIFTGGAGMSPERVARAGYRAMKRGDLLVVPGAKNRLLGFAARFSPRRLSARIAGKIISDA